MGLFEILKKRENKKSISVIDSNEHINTSASSAIQVTDTMPFDLEEVVNILKNHGCDIQFSDSEIKMAYDTSWFSEYRVIKSDGIYFYREVCMGGYNLEKRLGCSDVYASFSILCAEIICGMKYKKMIQQADEDYCRTLDILRRYKSLIEKSLTDSDGHSNFLIANYLSLIL